MRISMSSVGGGKLFPVLLVVSLFYGCAKESVLAPDESLGRNSKAQPRFMTFTGGAPPYHFSVYTSDFCPIGHVRRHTGVAWTAIAGVCASEDANYFNLYGDTYLGGGSIFPFKKGMTPMAVGPEYVLIPNQGGGPLVKKKLHLRFKRTAIHHGFYDVGWFNYDVPTDTWTVAPGASDYFEWSITPVGYWKTCHDPAPPY